MLTHFPSSLNLGPQARDFSVGRRARKKVVKFKTNNFF